MAKADSRLGWLDGNAAPLGGRPFWLSPRAAFVALILIVVGAGIIAHATARYWVMENVHRELSGVAHMKADQIERWLDERRMDVQVVVATPLFVSSMRRWLATNGQDPALTQQLQTHLDRVATAARFAHFCLRSAETGAPILTSHCHADSPLLREMAVTVAQRNVPQLEDFHRNEEDVSLVELGMFSPVLLGEGEKLRVVAHISVDPNSSLFPRLQQWPGASPSAETVLVRRDGDEVLFLSALRYRDDEPLTLRLPLSHKDLLASQAVRGGAGVIRGHDYREVPSVAYAMPVAGTPWYLIAKMDKAEADLWLDRLTFATVASVGLVLLVAIWWWVERQRYVAARHHDEVARAVLAERMDYLNRNTHDCILLISLDGRIRETNEQCLEIYGYSHDQMLAQDGAELLRPLQPDGDLHALWSRLANNGTLILDATHWRKNGEPVPVEISARAFKVADGHCIQAIVRDITERVQAVQALRDREEQLAAFFRASPNGMFILDRSLRLLKANEPLARAMEQADGDYMGHTLGELFPGVEPNIEPLFRHALDHNQRFHNIEVSGTIPADPGATHYWLISCNPIHDREGRPVALGGVSTNITERKRAEARILALSRLNAAVSVTNGAIARSETLQEVFRTVCQACVDHGRFRMAWVGLADAASGRVVPVEAWGHGTEYLDDLVIESRADASGSNPTGVAFLERRPMVSNDFAADPAMEHWREAAEEHGLHSCMALPLTRGGSAVGTLTVYGDQPGCFDATAVDLLAELAHSLSFAFDYFGRKEEREQAEAALARKAQELAEAQRIALLGSWDWNLLGDQFSCSDELRGLTGCDTCCCNTGGGFERFSSLFAPASLAEFERAVTEALAGRAFGELELEARDAGGETRWLLARADAQRNETGRVVRLRGTMQDITERRRVREQLDRYAAEIEDLYQNAPCGYHSIDGDGRFCLMNDTELTWLGYRRDEVAGRMLITDILTPASRARFAETFPQLKANGFIRDLELDMVARDGVVLPVLVNATSIYGEDGQFVMTRSMVFDMTERRAMERERERQAAHLAELSHRLLSVQEDERRRLSAELHDRTSPNLAALDINLRSLAKALSDDVSEEGAMLLDDASALLADTADSIRDVCADLRPPILDYAGLRPALESYAQQFAIRTGVDVQVECPGLPARFEPEVESTLFRIAQEALTNCGKHAGATRVCITLGYRNHELAMEIVDDGCGFSTEAIGSPGNAPGLGLLSMRERAQFVGGQLIIDSAPDRGTRLRVTIPVAFGPDFPGEHRRPAAIAPRTKEPSGSAPIDTTLQG